MDDPRMLVVDDDGVLRFNGRTAEERLAALDAPGDVTMSSAGRHARGIERRGRREGTWRYSIDGDERFAVQFEDDRAIDPPAGWIEAEWPRPSVRSYEEERALLEIVLREYRRPEDIERIYPMITARGHNSVPVVRALREALGLSLSEAKMALDAACTRDKQRR
jgi:hypothetical protein